MVKQNNSNYETTISQFSMHALNNETDFLNSETVILDTTLSQHRQFNDMQLAPNNKIYIAFSDYYLWAIENIDSPAPDCTVNPKSLWLKNKKGQSYLPNYFYYYINFNYLKSCNTISFNYLGVEATTYLWNFGDSQTSTEPNPTHEYATAGTYTITLTVTYNDNSTQTISKDIEVVEKSEKPVIEHE